MRVKVQGTVQGEPKLGGGYGGGPGYGYASGSGEGSGSEAKAQAQVRAVPDLRAGQRMC